MKTYKTNSDESSISAAPTLPSAAGFLFSCLLVKGAVDSTRCFPSCQAGEVTFRDRQVLARKLARAQAQEKQQMAMLKIFPENNSTPTAPDNRGALLLTASHQPPARAIEKNGKTSSKWEQQGEAANSAQKLAAHSASNTLSSAPHSRRAWLHFRTIRSVIWQHLLQLPAFNIPVNTKQLLMMKLIDVQEKNISFLIFFSGRWSSSFWKWHMEPGWALRNLHFLVVDLLQQENNGIYCSKQEAVLKSSNELFNPSTQLWKQKQNSKSK